MLQLASEVNRAFTAGGFLRFTHPGALPQAGDEAAPLAQHNLEEIDGVVAQ
jgi:hypothetical protein